MRKRQADKKRNKFFYRRGMTLVEIVTTVSIIGILAAVAVPNYARIKQQMNMEMVKQNMRIIGEKLTEIMGKQGGKAPSRVTWGNPAPGNEDELSLTANLGAIDQKGYTTEDWTPPEELYGYNFTSCPKDNAWGSSGDRCFRLDPFGVTEMPVGVGKWSGINTWNQFASGKTALDTLMNISASFANKVDVFTKLAEFAALWADYSRWSTYSTSTRGCDCDAYSGSSTQTYQTSNIASDKIPSSFFIVDANQIAAFNSFMSASENTLTTQGIHIDTRVQTVAQVTANCKANCTDLANVIASTQNPKGLEVSFKLDNPVETGTELNQRLPASTIDAILAQLTQ